MFIKLGTCSRARLVDLVVDQVGLAQKVGLFSLPVVGSEWRNGSLH